MHINMSVISTAGTTGASLHINIEI